MRNIILFLSVFTLVFILGGCTKCNDTKPQGDNLPQVNMDNLKNNESDTTVFGTCVDATSNTVSILTDNGDTVQYVCADVYTEDGTPSGSVIRGGKFVGDRMAIVGRIGAEENLADCIVNLTSLLGHWTSLDRDFEILDGGEVKSSIEAESNPYTAWHIFNGKLILSKDTFEICELGPDSLLLENDKGIYGYKRKLSD